MKKKVIEVLRRARSGGDADKDAALAIGRYARATNASPQALADYAASVQQALGTIIYSLTEGA